MRTILSLFRNYVLRFGPHVVVVFDGYSCGPSIKDQEHQRRSSSLRSIAACRSLTEDTTQIGPREPFLANRSNKAAFLKLLKEYLEHTGVTVRQANGDADTEIVSVAVQFATAANHPVSVLAEDTDILVLLLYHCNTAMSEVYLCSEPKAIVGRTTVPGKCIKISSVQRKIGTKACESIVSVHAFGGCDSTSAIFGHGKGTIFKQLTKNSTLHDHCVTLQSETATANEVKAAGLHLFVAVYGGKPGDSLAELRYSAYCSMSLSARFKPESLPPSESAAAMHALRAHYQSVVWATLGKTTLMPTDWGWKVQSNVLVPVQLEGDVAPSNLLKVIKCGCTTQCTRASCSCRTYGLHCLTACKPCHGISCTNRGIHETHVLDYENMNCADAAELVADDDLYFFDEEIV